MNKLRGLLLAAFLLLTPSLAIAAPMQSGASVARYGFFPAAAEIGQQLQELVTGNPVAEIEPQETFGTRALGIVLSTLKLLIAGGENFLDNFAALPQWSDWAQQQIADPGAMDRWSSAGRLLLLAMAGAFLAGWALDLILLPLRRRIYHTAFPTWLSKTFGILSWLILRLIPIVAFIATALSIVDASGPTKLVRFIVVSFVYAATLMRLVRLGLQLLFSPKVEAMRLLSIGAENATYIRSWITWYAGVALFGYFLIDIAGIVKVPAAAIMGFRILMALAIVAMTIVVIVQKRSFVSTFIRGDLSAARAHQSLADNLRLWLARTWHVLAIAYLVIGYFVTMTGPEGGFLLMQKGTLGTLLALFFVRLVFFMCARLFYKRNGDSFGLFKPLLKLVVKIAAVATGFLVAAAAWEVDVAALMESAWGQRILGSSISIASTLLALAFLYELIQSSVERKLNRRDADGNVIETSARAKTLLPMAKYTALIVLSLIGGLVTLSELGINTGPLLAGAGVLGVALGFGSQTLVKDFLTGLFIIVEDNISVGDIVKLGDNGGQVESMTIRTVRLRDVNGSLHVLPFSEITRIVNLSKGFSFAVMDIGVSYATDLDKAMGVMREVGEELAKDKEIGPLLLEPFTVLGVENLGDSAVTLRCRVKTLPGRHFDVRRAYQLRIKQRFDAEGIEIPFPQQVVYLRKEPEKA